jgi:hypothetical protein
VRVGTAVEKGENKIHGNEQEIQYEVVREQINVRKPK